MEELLFDPPFPFHRVAILSKSQRLQERLLEDARPLLKKKQKTLPMQSPTPILSTMNSPTPSYPIMDSTTPSPPSWILLLWIILS